MNPKVPIKTAGNKREIELRGDTRGIPFLFERRPKYGKSEHFIFDLGDLGPNVREAIGLGFRVLAAARNDTLVLIEVGALGVCLEESSCSMQTVSLVCSLDSGTSEKVLFDFCLAGNGQSHARSACSR